MAKKKVGQVKTLADCIMDGGIGGKIFRDIHNDYNRKMKMDEKCKAIGSLGTSRTEFPRSINKPPYEVICLDGGRVQNLLVKVYLNGIKDRIHTEEVLFWLDDHSSDRLYEDRP